jgi:ketosteroid isomerase-like protein
MRNAAIFLLLILSALGFAQAENPQLRKEIHQLYAQLDRAINKGDYEGGFALIDPSFVAVDAEGKKMTYKQFKAMINSMKGQMKGMRSRITVQQVQGDSQEAFAWLTMTHIHSYKEGGAWKKAAMTEKFVETLKKTPSGWKITYSQAVPKD